MLAHHLRNLDEKSLARQIYDEQVLYNWPGLVGEVKSICERLGVEDTNITNMSKKVLKATMSAAFRTEEERMMKEEMLEKKKVCALVEEDCLTKEYMKTKNLWDCREIFRIRSNMNNIRGNFKNTPQVKKDGALCVACGMEEEVNSHLTVCVEYQDVRQGKDLANITDMVSYFREVMARRCEIDNKL